MAPEPPIAHVSSRPEIQEVDPTVKKRAKNQSSEKILKSKGSGISSKKKLTESTGSKRQKKVEAKEQGGNKGLIASAISLSVVGLLNAMDAMGTSSV